MIRRIVALPISGTTLAATHHAPASRMRAGRPAVGLVLFNAGPAPRAGNSDLSVHLADAVARNGMDCFRVDLPGLGDSCGAVPTLVVEYGREALEGRNDAVATETLDHLASRFGMTSFILGGLCAGATTSVRLAADGRSRIAGLVLLEPNFRFAWGSERRRAEKKAAQGAAERGSNGSRSWRDRAASRLLKSVRRARKLDDLWRSAVNRGRVRGLPDDVDHAMIDRWVGVIRAEVPTLLFNAAGKATHELCDAVLRFVPPRHRQSVRDVPIFRTNHLLTAGDGRSIILAETLRWIADEFEGGTTDPHRNGSHATATPSGEVRTALRDSPD
jgi:pimeloyl-ACP methyl ester carboxylesterase